MPPPCPPRRPGEEKSECARLSTLFPPLHERGRVREGARAVIKECASVCICISLVFVTALHAQEIPSVVPPGVKVPHVVLMSMGGTIASKATDRMNINNYGGKGLRVEPQEWVDALPELAQVARVTTEDMRPPETPEGVGGPGTTFEELYKVAHRLQELAKDPSVDVSSLHTVRIRLPRPPGLWTWWSIRKNPLSSSVRSARGPGSAATAPSISTTPCVSPQRQRPQRRACCMQ